MKYVDLPVKGNAFVPSYIMRVPIVKALPKKPAIGDLCIYRKKLMVFTRKWEKA